MGEAKRKTYTASFKAKVGLEAIRGVKTVNEIGQERGVYPAQVGATHAPCAHTAPHGRRCGLRTPAAQQQAFYLN